MNWQETLTQLEAGTVRAANQDEQGNWHANVEVKEAILSAFKAGENIAFDGIYKGFVAKHNLPAREFTADDKVRLVPGGSSVRRGAHVDRYESDDHNLSGNERYNHPFSANVINRAS